MTLFETLKDRCRPEWEAYTRHEFVQRLGDGTLPLPVFQDYLVQDYHFLVQFARANALAMVKSRTLADLQAAHAATGAILAETDLHIRLTERWGVPRAELDAAPEKQATVAYTRYVLDCGMVGDLLDLHVALAPCTIGYAEIGAELAPVLEGNSDHPYREWIEEYSGEPFTAAARNSIAQLDSLAGGGVDGDAVAGGGLTERRLDELTEVFRTASRLEADFWQQALDSAR